MEQKIEGNSPYRAGVYDNDWLQCTVTALQMSVNAIGIQKDLQPALEHNIQKNAGPFNLAFETEASGEKLRLNLQFNRDSFGYDFSQYGVTLLHAIPIEYRTLNGIDTQVLENRMKTMDWYYGISETTEGVIQGFKKATSIETDLKQLSRTEEGSALAVHLWHNHVPADTVSKPDFIAQAEVALDLYAERTFPNTVKIGEACDIVRGYSQEELLVPVDTNIRPGLAFYEQEPGEIKQHLQKLESDGNKYVAYIEGSIPMTKDSLFGCKNSSDIIKFNVENTNGLNRCTFSSIEYMRDAAEKWSRLSEEDINPNAIERKMAVADWHCETASQSREQSVKREVDMESIHKDLALLCNLPGGIDKASALWDKYAPDTTTKPHFLQKDSDLNSGLLKTPDANGRREQLKAAMATQTNAEPTIKSVRTETPAKEKGHKQRRRMQ